MCWKAVPAVSRPDGWMNELELLALRFSHLGFGPDLSLMTVVELAGLYSFLARLADASK